MNNVFETSKKKSKKRPLGRFVRGLRALFNLAMLTLSSTVTLLTLYVYRIFPAEY